MYSGNDNYRAALANSLKTMRLISEGLDVYPYIYDIDLDRMYFAGAFDERYRLPPMTDGYYSSQTLMGFLRRWAAAKLMLSDLPEVLHCLCQSEYWLDVPGGETVLLKNEVWIEHDSNGKPRWLIGRMMDALAEKNIDELTGFFDQDKMLEDLQQSMANGSRGYLMVLGIDNLRSINIKHGREQGNQVIKSMGEGLERSTRGLGEVYRLSGDKFGVLLYPTTRDTVEALYAVVRKECASVGTFSGGVAEFDPDLGADENEVFQRAESTFNAAKHQGKNMLLFYSQDMFAHQLDMLNLQDELAEAVRSGCKGFFLTYQPQIQVKTLTLFGLEALLRFRSPSRGLVSPVDFVPILEQTGMIVQVGQWVLETALAQVAQWRKFLPQLHISINLSYQQLRRKNIAQTILDTVERSGVPGSAITLEVTESVQLQDFQKFNLIFYKLKRIGIQIAIDDFGTGYSSLSYLKRIAIDEVKIDRCFISRIQHSSYNHKLLSNIIELSHSANIRVCCEGMETDQEFLVISPLRPELIQGYLFGKPLEPAQFEERYIHEDREAYALRRKQEDYFRTLANRNDRLDIPRAENERLSAIIDSMEELVYVRDIETHELIYLNSAGRELTGYYDYKGCKCYKVMMNRDTPCEFCTQGKLCQDTYLVREMANPHLNRHFMLKEKLIEWEGELAALTVALDVTEKEITSQRIQDKLKFEENIVKCTHMLMGEQDIRKAISGLLQSVGTFYHADRAYLFERQEGGGFWSNTYEWCAPGIPSALEDCQNIPGILTQRWMNMFRSGESVNIDNVEQLRHHAPREGEFLSGMGVQRLILAPVWQDGEISAFIGVDNPSVNAHASGQIETIAMLLADRLVRDKTKDRLQELLNLHYEDILKATDLGLWVIRLKKDGSAQEMYVDQTMRSILGIRENLTPQEVYHHWYNRINPGYFHYVNYSLEHMIESGRTVELRYTWNHPIKGETTVRFLGIRVADLEDYICLEGYHREINEVDMPHYMPEATSIIFEYNESKASIYFHNKRHPLAGEEEREDNFPQCWVESGMVHPHFARQFADVFRDIRNKPDQNGRELRLKTKDGGYEWFKLKTRHLSSDSHDANTMIVILDPANQTRTMELEYSRQKDFYNAILAEKIAYAEIDMESHRILHMGGLWANYADKTTRNETPYEQVMLHYADLLVHPEDLKSYKSFIQADSVYGMLDQKDGNKIQLRRLINGEMRWVELTAHTFQDGVTGNVFALMYMRDIDAAKRRELQHELAATRDPLTKVFNRLTFEEEVVRHMTENREANCGTLLLIDMDNFKEVNDRYGHSEGDAVLMALTDILLTTFRRKDLIGRFGGDEFLVFLKNVTDKKVINRRMEELKSALVGLGQWNVTCSVGAVRIPAGPFDYGESIRKADEAMYFSKDKGKNAFSFYDELR